MVAATSLGVVRMKRVGLALVTLSLAVTLLAVSPAHAGGAWDPNEPIHRLDIRWVGAYEQADGRLRVTITFYDPVRLRWFERLRFGSLSTLVVAFTPDRDQRPFMFGLFGRRGDRLIAAMCESGSNCGGARVRRPNRFTIRAWFDEFDALPGAGWSFRGFSWRGSGGRDLLDRTRWSTVT
jgi:hypothetical protein